MVITELLISVLLVSAIFASDSPVVLSLWSVHKVAMMLTVLP